MFVLGFVLYASTMLLPIFLQTLMGYDALTSGLVLSPGGFAVILLMPLVGTLLTHFAPRWLVVFGLTVCALGLFRMPNFDTDIDFRTAMMARVVQSMGMAFLFVPINTMAFAALPKEQANRATGIINLARNVGGSTGIAMVTTLLARRSQFHQSVLVSHVNAGGAAYRSLLEHATHMFLSRGSDPVHVTRQAQALLYGLVGRQASMQAFVDNFWMLGIIFLAIIPVVLLAKPGTTSLGPARVASH
jgi:DHA2 family multidrug resistance protein